MLAVLLDRLRAGGVLAGQAVRPGKAVVVSEESPQHWLRRSQKLAFGEHVCWLCRPFRGKPTRDQWLGLVDLIADLDRVHGLALAAVDPLAAVLPGRNENAAGVLLDALLPLQRLTARGLSVLLLHHPRKHPAAAGLAARGSGALAAFADIVLEMYWYGAPGDSDRRRRVHGFSRFEETPRGRVIELTADGTDWVSHGDWQEAEFADGWPAVYAVLAAARDKMTRRQILEQWPLGFKSPDEVTLWRWLEQARDRGQVARDGRGTRYDPYCYWLPGQEKKWAGNPFAGPEKEDLFREAEKVLQEVPPKKRGKK